jgi:hypothetical protein
MELYHATPTSRLPAILAHGLDPQAPGYGVTNLPGVYLAFDPEFARDFVTHLNEAFGDGGPVAVLAVDVDGLALEDGDDDPWTEQRVNAVVEPARLRLLP